MVLTSSIPEVLSTAAASFLLGWTLKNSSLAQRLSSLRVAPLIKTKMVIVVRGDLPLSKGKLAAQCSHAAVSCYRQGMKTCPELSETWVLAGEPKIIVKSDSPGEEGLKKLARKSREIGLVATMIRDAGRTEVARGTATVLGIGPGRSEKIDEVTSHLRLL